MITCFRTFPNAEAYPIDYRMEGKSGGQVFLYGVPNRDKARLTTIILSPPRTHPFRIRGGTERSEEVRSPPPREPAGVVAEESLGLLVVRAAFPVV